jgi:hypothetical protein
MIPEVIAAKALYHAEAAERKEARLKLHFLDEELENMPVWGRCFRCLTSLSPMLIVLVSILGVEVWMT